MNDSDDLIKLERVFAPADFEDRVLAAVVVRRREMPARRRAAAFRRAAAGSAAVLMAGLVAWSLFFGRGPSSSAPVLAEAGSGPAAYHIIEPVDYRGDLQAAANAPGDVYILERMSEASHTLIKY
jgi:hypothetical protein